MTIKIAITGKSGSGKTTVAKAFLDIIKERFPNKTILLFDNDLSGELARSFNLDIKNTIYGIRSGKHEYKTGIPQQMTKQEYVEWAMEDIIVPIDEDVDIIVSWLGGLKDCRCPITSQVSYAIKRIIKRYDFVIFDCEYDLKYLTQLVDIDIDLSLVIANSTKSSINLAQMITESSAKYAIGGQLGIIINKVDKGKSQGIIDYLTNSNIEILGTLPFANNVEDINESAIFIKDSLNELYCRLNLPQENIKE